MRGDLVLPNLAEVYIHIMSVINKLSKEVFNIATYTKDVLKTNVTNSALNGEISLNHEQLNQLLKLIENSVDQATQKGLVIFEKSAKNLFEYLIESNLSNQTTAVVPSTTARKK